MAIYLVENEDAPINNFCCYWLVRANTAKEAVDRVYLEENRERADQDAIWSEDPVVIKRAIAAAARWSGILKRKLTAVKVDDKLFCGDCNTYMIC